jgi:hypothetical protein
VANIRLRQAKARRLVNDLALLGRALEIGHAAPGVALALFIETDLLSLQRGRRTGGNNS